MTSFRKRLLGFMVEELISVDCPDRPPDEGRYERPIVNPIARKHNSRRAREDICRGRGEVRAVCIFRDSSLAFLKV